MKVLYADMIYYKGHKYFDEKTIDNLSSVCELTVLSPSGWFRKNNSVCYIENGYNIYLNEKTRINSWISAINNLWKAIKICKEERYDVLVIGECEILAYYFMRFYLGKKVPVIIVHHNDLDQLRYSRIKSYMFNRIKGRVFHCILESYIEDWLVQQQGINPKHIFVWNHPMEREKAKIQVQARGEFDCIALSNSNDENVIQQIINNEKSTRKLEQKGLHVVLKSKKTNYDSDSLKVITGWITAEDYSNYLQKTKSVLITLPKSFCYRVSTSIIEAFFEHIPVFGNESELFNYYSKQYPCICKRINLDYFSEQLETINNDESMKLEFDRFLFDHSDQVIQMNMRRDLERIKGEKI